MSVSALGGKTHDKHDSVSEGDEELAVSMSEDSETLDHLMEVAQKATPVLPHFQYTREELMEIQSHPLSKRRPECLDPAFNNSRGVWDPERWHLDRKRSETPPEDERGVRGDLTVDHKRRSGDPRERIRKEQDGIVLSPQRRSFNSGCFVNISQNNRRAESPLGKTDRDRDVGHRDMAPTRRIGSGRILTQHVWDFRLDREKDSDQQVDYTFQRSGSTGTARDRERDRDRDERYERRSFGRDFDRDRDKDRHRDRAERNRYADRRRAYSDSREEEPEWFSGGPTSQHDTIELRGFEDIPEEQVARGVSKKQSVSQSKIGKSGSRAVGLSRRSSDSVLQQQPSSAGPTGRSTPTPVSAITVLPDAPHSPILEDVSSSKADDTALTVKASEEDSSADKPTMNWEPQNAEENGPSTLQNSEFNLDLDDILKIDSLPLLTNGTAVEGPAGSRFCQFFRRESPVNQPESRRSSLQDELLNNIINDITEPNIVIPPLSESDTYFAPISPAANTVTSTVSVSAVGSSVSSSVMSCGNGGTGSSGSVSVKPTLLLEMLQRGGQNQVGQGDAALPPIIRAPSIRDLEAAGKMQSVEELEARMRQQGLNVAQQNNNKSMVHSSLNKKTEEDLAAFKKLMLSKSQQETAVTAGRPVTHQQSLSTAVSTSADQVGLTPLSGFGLNSHPSSGPTVVTSQAQMQIPQDLVMKLLQVQQQQQRQQQQQQQQQEMLNKLLVSSQQQQSQASSRLGHVPLAVSVPTQFQAPPPPSLSPLPPELQLMITNAQPSIELLQRPEAQAIIQGLKLGEITSQHLVQQLQNPAMQHRHREVLVSILKLQLQPGVSPRATSPHPHVQQPELLHQMMLQQQQQQHQQQQLRIPSPLNSAYCQQPPVISPNLANNPNTLSVQHTVLQHRVPSPRELIVHTQNIMQSALIKKKLEEQRENFRKRQEMQQSLSPNVSGMSSNATNSGPKINDSSSPAKHLSSPTPLAFTPTSVLRKMTAEKEAETSGPVSALRNDSKAAVSAPNDLKPQSVIVQTSQRMSSSATHLRSQQTAAPPWNIPKQHPGRPIVKGNANFQYTANVDYQQQQQQQQQQHRHSSLISGGGSYSNSVPRSKMTLATPPANMTPQINTLMMMNRSPNVRAQAFQAHLATLHQPQHHTHHHNQQQQQQQQQHQQQQQRNMPAPSLQQILLNQNFGSVGRGSGKTDSRMLRTQQSQAVAIGRPSQTINLPVNRDMSTSPTSNQLARWFSPELLAQARAGQLPDMPPIPSTQNMLSLEELERLQQASAAVHN